MFGRRRIEELEYEVSVLNECLERSQNENKILKKQNGEYQDVLKEQNEYTCEQLFDFANTAVNVLSIERQKRDNMWVTNIGYLINNEHGKKDEDKIVHEWWMVTSRSQHQKLVDEYKNSKGV
jgi:predicted nuclease with TOPRIM domain